MTRLDAVRCLLAAALACCAPGWAIAQSSSANLTQQPAAHDHANHGSDAQAVASAAPDADAQPKANAQPDTNAIVTWINSPPASITTVTINVLETVTWNGVFSSHPLEATDSMFSVGTQTMATTGTTFTLGFVFAGTYYFRCGNHPMAMRTTVIVAGPGGPPIQLGAVSRRTHGGVGAMDLPLSAGLLNPTTEPRQGPAQTIVVTFDKPIASANAAISEGVAVAGAPTFSGNEVIVGLTGVIDQQYVTVTLTNVSAADGGTGGSASVRVGFLLGDVNQSRVVTLTDLGLVNGQLAQPVSAANFLKDVNASGTLTLTDKGLTNGNLTRALPPP